MNNERLIFETFTEPTVDLEYAVNLSHGSLYRHIKLIANEYLRVNESPIILLDIRKGKKSTVFHLKVLENEYENNPEFFNEILEKIINEISVLTTKENINEINIVKKIPSLENCLPKSKKKMFPGK